MGRNKRLILRIRLELLELGEGGQGIGFPAYRGLWDRGRVQKGSDWLVWWFPSYKTGLPDGDGKCRGWKRARCDLVMMI